MPGDNEAFVREAARKQATYARTRQQHYDTVVLPTVLARQAK